MIVKLRRLRMTAAEIAETLAMPLSTVSGILTRIGLGRLGRIGLEPADRYERSRPGELLHIDVKKLGRIRGVGHRISGSRATQAKTRISGRRTGIAGWEYVHIAVDDYSRLAYAEVLADETAATAAGFLRRAVAFYRRHGIRSSASSPTTAPATAPSARARLPPPRHPPPPHPPLPPTDQRQSRTLHPHPAHRLGLRRRSTRSSRERTAALDGWLWHYNHRRRHSARGERVEQRVRVGGDRDDPRARGLGDRARRLQAVAGDEQDDAVVGGRPRRAATASRSAPSVTPVAVSPKTPVVSASAAISGPISSSATACTAPPVSRAALTA